MMHSPVMLQRELLRIMQDSHRISASPVLLSKDLLKAGRNDTHKLWAIAGPFLDTWSAGLPFSNVKCTVTKHPQISVISGEEEEWSLLATA